MNIVITLKGGVVEAVRFSGPMPEGTIVYVEDKDLPRYDNGAPVLQIADAYEDLEYIDRIETRFDTEDGSDLAVHGQENLDLDHVCENTCPMAEGICGCEECEAPCPEKSDAPPDNDGN